MINIALLSKEVDYNLPHRVSVKQIKDGILTEIESEKKRIENEKDGNNENSKENIIEKQRIQRSNYEDLFKIDPNRIFYFSFC